MTELTVSVDERLAAQVEESAARYGLPIDDYVASLLAAAETPGGADRAERATALARTSFRRWNEGGRSEEGAMSMTEVFG